MYSCSSVYEHVTILTFEDKDILINEDVDSA